MKPFDTPVTMLLTSARVVPHIARDCLVSLAGAIVTAPSAIVAVTVVADDQPQARRARPWRSGCGPESWTSTPCGTGTGIFADA